MFPCQRDWGTNELIHQDSNLDIRFWRPALYRLSYEPLSESGALVTLQLLWPDRVRRSPVPHNSAVAQESRSGLGLSCGDLIPVTHRIVGFVDSHHISRTLPGVLPLA